MCLCVHPEYCMGHNYIYTHMICIYIFHYKFHIMHIWRGTQHSGIIFWRWDTSVSVYQWSCCERLDSASAIFFWRLFQCVCPFYDGWFKNVPAQPTLSVQQFLTKWHDLHAPPSLFTPHHPKWFAFPGWKKSSQGNVLPTWKRWNKKRQQH